MSKRYGTLCSWGTANMLVAVALLVGGVLVVSPVEADNHERHILFNSDSGNAFAEFWSSAAHLGTMDAEAMKSIMETSVDELAAAGVDALATVVWARFLAMVPSKVMPDPFYWGQGYVTLSEAGYDPVDLMIDRCHQHDMEFIACFRMNDRHGGAVGRFISDHPEWQLKGVRGGPAVNYAYEPVRQEILAYIKELLSSYDVDGIELDYMRWCHMFEPGEGRQNAHLLTDFTRKTRQLLDAAAQRRGRERLVLGVRVPQTLQECDYLGFDVATWIKEGLVDYVVPSDFFYTDFNARTEDFVKLAEGTNCKIYPAIHPIICEGDDVRINGLTNYRAAARNFYAYGADGVEAYNYQYHWGRRIGRTTSWPTYMWPAALGYLGKLADPQDIAKHDRHYRFYRLWENGAPTGEAKDDRIVLDRTESAPQGSQRFRLAEDLSNPNLRATLQFKAVGLGEDEALEIQLNGTVVPDNYILRQFYSEGQNEWQGRPLDAFYEYTIDLDWGMLAPPIINGDNELTVRLLPAQGQSEGTATIDELEVYVYVKT